MSVKEATNIIKECIVDTPLMDIKNISKLILSYTIPNDIVIRFILNEKSYDFTYTRFQFLIQKNNKLIKDIINSGIATIQIINKNKCSNNIDTFGFENLNINDTTVYFKSHFGYNNSEELLQFLTIFKQWDSVNRML
jgi:hypothetical protein